MSVVTVTVGWEGDSEEMRSLQPSNAPMTIERYHCCLSNSWAGSPASRAFQAPYVEVPVRLERTRFRRLRQSNSRKSLGVQVQVGHSGCHVMSAIVPGHWHWHGAIQVPSHCHEFESTDESDLTESAPIASVAGGGSWHGLP